MGNYHHEDLKKELLESGLKMIRSEGIEKLSLRKLAKACGVSEAAPYSHFKNKDELLEAMKEYVTKNLYDRLLESYNATADKKDPHCILNMGKAYVSFALEQPDFFNFIFNQANISIDLSMEGKADFKPFGLFRDKSFDVYRGLGMDDEKIKYGIVAMWTQVHGIAIIASMKNVKTDFLWSDALERLLVEK